MVRWLVLLLVFVLPVQFVCAAAANYCGHESQPTASHLGHHAPMQEVSVSDAGDHGTTEASQSGSIAVEHADCNFSHVSLAQFASPADGLVTVDTIVFSSSSASFFLSWTVQEIDRPKWARAV